MLALFEAIKSGSRHGLLQPTPAMSNASLQFAKATLDSYAGQLSDEQQQRLKEANKKRKRGEPGPAKGEVLKIRKLHVEGFDSGQVWQQARRIISSTLEDSKDALEDLEANNQIETNGIDRDAKTLDSEEDDFGFGSENNEEESEGESVEDASRSGEEDDALSDDEDVEGELEDGIDDEDFAHETFGAEEDEYGDDDETEALVEDPNGLNDGFFSIDDFNKMTQWFEDQDAKADPNTDAVSDDEEIDWHANPMAGEPVVNGKSKKTNGTHDDSEDEMPSGMDEDDDEDGGPTFGNMDLNAPEGASEDEAEAEDDDMDGDMGGDFNANDIFYRDFFDPPRKKRSRNWKPKSKDLHGAEPDDEDIERAMNNVRHDLFEDESERSDSEDALSDVSAGNPKSRKSAHERRQAKLAEEIRRLEAENVAQKKWTLSGEARAADRPKHSLLEEDLDFEHAGKPVPVITAEVSESIEEMIKRRILAQEFDEVIKRRPDSLGYKSDTRRGLVELDDTRAKQSLAEIYEEEHVKNSNPDTYISKADEKLRKEEKEIENMWKEISAKLDSLSSWHYRPKPTEPTLTVVADVATVSMEDAQPATAQGVSGGDNTLAPQEVYKASKENAEKGEVVAKSGLPVAKQELSREDKARSRRRQKERIRKAVGIGNKPLSGKAAAQKETLGQLKKGGVKVINKNGEILDMEGNKAKTAKAASSGSFKL